MRHPIHKSSVSGSLTTGLPEDVFHLVDSQLSLLEDYLRAKCIISTETGSNVAVEAVLSIVRNLWYHHTNYRYTFLQDVESSIAAANDLMRKLEKLEEMMRQVGEHFPQVDWREREQGGSATFVVRREIADLVSLFSTDAVNACQRAVNHIMRNIHNSSIASDLFTREWEGDLIQNEVAVAIVRTFEDYLSDLRDYIEHDFLYHKVVAAMVRATVCFYTQCFVKKAHKLRRALKRGFPSKRASTIAFMNSKRAITRMTYDIQVFQEYFETLARHSPPLMRLVVDELSVFVVFIECMWLAVGRKENDSLDEYVVVVHKKISGADAAVTRHFLSDLWLLLGPKNEHYNIEKVVKRMDTELKLMSAMVKQEATSTRVTLDQSSCLRLDEVLHTMYEDRILQENSSLCVSFVKDIKDAKDRRSHSSDEEDSSNFEKPWEPLKEIKKRMTSNRYERELSLIFKKL